MRPPKTARRRHARPRGVEYPSHHDQLRYNIGAMPGQVTRARRLKGRGVAVAGMRTQTYSKGFRPVDSQTYSRGFGPVGSLKGDGFWDDLKSGLSKVWNVAKVVAKPIAAGVATFEGGPAAGMATANLMSQFGLGRKRRRRARCT